MKYNTKSRDEKVTVKGTSFSKKYTFGASPDVDPANVALQPTKRRRYQRRGSKAPSMFYSGFVRQTEPQSLEAMLRLAQERQRLLKQQLQRLTSTSSTTASLGSCSDATTATTDTREEFRRLCLQRQASSLEMNHSRSSTDENRTLRRLSLSSASDHLRNSAE